MVNPYEDTEFNDALRAQGILPPKPPTPPSPSANLPDPDELYHAALQTASADKLQTLEEDAIDSDEERMFASYRAERLRQMKEAEAQHRSVKGGGEIREISRDEFVKEVSEGSKQEIEGEEGGTGVVCFLYNDAIPLSNHLRQLLKTLAPHLPLTRFLSIRGDQCIANYPDRNIPTLLLYRGGECLASVVPINPGPMGFPKGLKTRVEDVQGILLAHKLIDAPSATLGAWLRKQREDESDDEDDGVANVGAVRSVQGKSIRQGAKARHDDSGSDYDM